MTAIRHYLLAATLACGFGAVAKAADQRNATSYFVQQCQNPASEDIAHTIRVLRDHLEEQDCAKAWAKLKDIDFLEITNKELKDLSPIKEMEELVILNISKNLVNDLSFIQNMPKLKMITARTNHISDLNPLVTGAPNLAVIDVGKNNVSDISMLNKLTSLFEITAYNNAIKDLECSNLVDLETLDLRKNYLENIECLRGHKQLITVDIAFNNIADISPLESHLNMWRLDVAENRIRSIEAVAGMKNLIEFSGQNNEIEDISALAELPKLKNVFVNNNNISEIPVFVSPDIGGLYLGGNAIADASNLAKLKVNNLKILDVGSNAITSIPGGDYLAQVWHLYVEDNQLSDIEFVSSAHELSSFSAEKNAIKDISPLASAKRLNSLGLSDNLIDDISPLKELEEIDRFKMNKNPLGTSKTKTASNCPTDAKSKVVADWCASL